MSVQEEMKDRELMVKLLCLRRAALIMERDKSLGELQGGIDRIEKKLKGVGVAIKDVPAILKAIDEELATKGWG